MKRISAILTLLFATTILCFAEPNDYTFTSPSANSAGSMPVGGGGIGLNVWCNDAGIISFYVSQSGTFDENNTMLKVGRFTLAPFTHWDKSEFTQTLHTTEGYMTLSQGNETVTIWCDVYKPVIHVEVDSKSATDPTIAYESWRTEDVPLMQSEGQQSSWKWLAPKKADIEHFATRKDSIEAEQNQITFFHQNRDVTVFDYTVHDQQLDAWKDSLSNPLKNRIFGGRMTGVKASSSTEKPEIGKDAYGRSFHFWRYAFADGKSRHHKLQIALCCQQSSLADWRQQISETLKAVNISRDRIANRKWWNTFMRHSFVETECNDAELQQCLRNAMLFHYMLGCNYQPDGEAWPTKFNGGLFAFDPLEVDSTNTANFKAGKFHPTPDFRKWGGGTFTAQNQRLVYWCMLKNGDLDLLQAQLDFYLRLLPNAELRTRAYWGHEGACYTEQLENYGLPNTAEYGQKRPAGFDPGLEYNAWLEYLWDTSLEFCQMAIQAWRQDSAFPIAKYEPMILSCLKFFDEHYQMLAKQRGRKALDSNGQLVLYPGTGCETYKMTYNSASTIAALKRVSMDYCKYLKEKTKESVVAKNKQEAEKDSATLLYIEGLSQRIPPVPTRLQQGKECIAPAIAYERINNVETPQLYPVWPWRITTKELGINTYQCDSVALKHRSYKGWKQDNIWAACLGLTDEAYNLTMQKLKDGPYRFPAFWGPGFDWSPDHNWGGSALIGLEEMLMQEDPETGELTLLPAWPMDKDIHFKLHATRGRIVEVTLKDGKISQKITEKFGEVK